MLGLSQPKACAFEVFKDSDSVIEDARETGQAVGLVGRERLAAGAAVLEGAGGDDDVVEVFEGDARFGDEGGHGGDGNAGLDCLQIEVEGGEERSGAGDFGGLGHRDIMP